jgi:type IV pilus assembly protein PilA
MQTNNRKGFTLIELLIVVVIIGILAAIAIPKFANTKEKAYVASMKADLKNLVNAQESYFADKGIYATEAELGANMTQSPGNDITIGAVSATGWNATVINPSVTTVGTTTCGIYTGAASNAPNAAVKAEGAPACW